MQPYRVVDADGHVEPAIGATWARFLKEPYLSWITKHAAQVFDREGDRSARRRGAWEPRARLADMDTEGIDVAVLFGGVVGLSTGIAENEEYALAYARGYNDWLADYCNADPARLKGVAIVPMDYPEAGARELERAVKELGFVGLCTPPLFKGANIDDHHKFPVYQAAQELDVPLMVHGPGGLRAQFSDRYHTHFQRHMFDFPLSVMLGSMDALTSGLLDTFPKLRFAFLEGACGWVPWWLDRLDEHFEKLPHQAPHITHRPSEYLKTGRLFFSCESDEPELPHVIERLGEDVILYASDYPHWDCIFPESVNVVLRQEALSESAKRKLLRENAVRLFGGRV